MAQIDVMSDTPIGFILTIFALWIPTLLTNMTIVEILSAVASVTVTAYTIYKWIRDHKKKDGR